MPISSYGNELITPSDFKSRRGLGLMDLKVQSMIDKMDTIDIWLQDTCPDIVSLRNTVKWLSLIKTSSKLL